MAHTARQIAAGIALILAWLSASHLAARPGDTRTISFYNIHTKENLTVTFKKDGYFQRAAMKKINHIMRDWRQGEETTMDPNTIDLLWEMHTELGSSEPIHIISGYRSPKTNNMLRKTRGGQAKRSQHMTGRAIDVHFPDIPTRQLRYSALIRERGGVGYYPTSAIPFVHVDTARVRHWPRMGHQELALLFPGGYTKHRPASGGPITRADVRAARAKRADLVQKVAAFYKIRASKNKIATRLALAGGVPKPTPVKRPALPETAVAALTPTPPLAYPDPVRPVPRLVTRPQIAERPAEFQPDTDDLRNREQMERLVTLASLQRFEPGVPKPIAPPQPASRLRPEEATRPPSAEEMAERAATQAADRAALARLAEAHTSAEVEEATGRFGWGSSFVSAPEFDPDHPDELAYRPFPREPMRSRISSIVSYAELQPLDVGRTLELMDDGGVVEPMRLRPAEKVAQAMWTQQFRGSLVNRGTDEKQLPSGMNERAVKTTVR